MIFASPIFITIQVILVGISFLINLNAFLRGAKKDTGFIILGALVFGLSGLAWYLYGLLAGLGSFAALQFLYKPLTVRFARSTARRILGYRTSYETGPNRLLRKIQHANGGGEMLEILKRQGEETDARIERIARRKDVAEVIKLNGMTIPELKDHYYFLVGKCSLGDLAWEIISDSNDLRQSIMLERQGLDGVEIFSRLTSLKSR